MATHNSVQSGMRDPSQLKGWEQYPENLDSESHNVDFVYNSAFFHERLGAESSRLFVQSPDRVVVKVIELGVGGKSSASHTNSSSAFYWQPNLGAVTEKILEDAPALETFLQVRHIRAETNKTKTTTNRSV